MKSKKVLVGAIVGAVALGGVVFGTGLFDNLKMNMFYSKNNITSEVVEDFNSHLELGNDYLIYLYDRDNCEKCDTYTEDLKAYMGKNEALELYKINLEKLMTKTKEEKVGENKFLADERHPTLLHVKNGEEFYRYVGSFDIELLPKK